jgi:hypothetical protein
MEVNELFNPTDTNYHSSTVFTNDDIEIISTKSTKILENCDQNKFLETGDLNELKDCYYLFPDIKPEIINNPLNITEKCYRINSKKEEYYIYKYDPTNIINNIIDFKQDNFDKLTEYGNNLDEVADLTPKNNCCNCVTFTLYSTYDTNKIKELNVEILNQLHKIYAYLYSLKISVTNIDNKLTEFISRIYIDISVFKFLFEVKKLNDKYTYKTDKFNNLLKTNIEIIEYLFTNKSTEIYTIVCNSYIGVGISKTRTLRLICMTEPDVNIKIFREADGYVTYLDCMNIKNFINANTLMLIYNFRPSFKSPGNLISSNNLYYLKILKINFDEAYRKSDKVNQNIINVRYSHWLKKEEPEFQGHTVKFWDESDYKIYNDNFDNNKYEALFDLLSGLTGIAIQVKPEYFNLKLSEINDILTEKTYFSLDERLLYRLFIKLIGVKGIKHQLREPEKIILDKPLLNNILFVLNNFSYPTEYLGIQTFYKYIEKRDDYLYSKNIVPSTYTDICIKNISNNISNINSLINKDYIDQLILYYRKIIDNNIIKDIIYDKDYRGYIEKYAIASILLILIDIIFQDNLFTNNKNIITISVGEYDSINMLNIFTYLYKSITNYVYIDRPFIPMSKEVLSLYRGGMYEKKYLKYIKKYIKDAK